MFFQLIKDHDINYNDRSYVRNRMAYYDYKSLLITKEKLSNYKYSIQILKEIIIDKKIFSKKDIKDYFASRYSNIEFKFSDSESEAIINKYKKTCKIPESEEISIDKIIYFDKQISLAVSFVNKMYDRKNTIHNLLIELKNEKNESLIKYLSYYENYRGKNYKNDIYNHG